MKLGLEEPVIPTLPGRPVPISTRIWKLRSRPPRFPRAAEFAFRRTGPTQASALWPSRPVAPANNHGGGRGPFGTRHLSRATRRTRTVAGEFGRSRLVYGAIDLLDLLVVAACPFDLAPDRRLIWASDTSARWRSRIAFASRTSTSFQGSQGNEKRPLLKKPTPPSCIRMASQHSFIWAEKLLALENVDQHFRYGVNLFAPQKRVLRMPFRQF